MASDISISSERLTAILSALSLAKMQLTELIAAREERGDVWLGLQLKYTVLRISQAQAELTKDYGDFYFDWNQHDQRSQE